jgi:PEP-CTERM motif
LRIKLLVILSLLLTGSTHLIASTLSFSGNFSTDDVVVLIPFMVVNSGPVVIQTTSFAASDGFEPVLTLYDASGNLFLQDATGGTTPGGCGVRSIDSVSGFCLDAVIQNFLNAGAYTLALTEYDNIPGGPTLADGFPQTGNGNFTGPEFLGSDGSFILFDGEQRTSDWALNIDVSGEPVAPVPEPAPLGLIGIGLMASLFAARRRSGPVRSFSTN